MFKFKLYFVIKIAVMLLIVHRVHGECAWNADRISSMCSVNAIDRSTLMDLERVAATTSLTIKCDPALMYESVLSDRVFQKMQSIESLSIEACKLLSLKNGTFTGMVKLQSLKINTRNSEWGLGNKLEMENGLFAQLADVQQITLTSNNLRTLPANIFCPLKNLVHLNLSENRIRTTNDLGFNECGDNLMQLKAIDLSANELFVFDHNWTRSDLRSLENVYLQQNNLTKIYGSVFNDLPALKVLNLSANYLETLPNGLFSKNVNLREIYLQNNKLYQLPKDIFANLNELMVLDLSNNQLSSHYIDSAIFGQLKRLVILNLSNNALTRIDSKTFNQLNVLQVLDMRNNSIGFIDDRAFAPLTNLHTLNLAGNRLHIINNGLFNGMYVLDRLVLSNNLITVVESSAFVNCSSLKELDLSSNQLSDIPDAVHALRMLKSLDLGENRISVLRNDSFLNLNQLTGLRLMDNLIVNITCGCLFDLPKLNVLNLAKNKIQSIQRGSFDKNSEIEAIRLDKNLLNDVDGIFATLSSLLWLNLSENQLIWFDYAFIPMNLKWLDVHGNYIEALGNYYKLQSEITVTTLDASHNRITELAPTSVPNSIELFFVNNNLIRNVYPNTFIDKINLTRVDLYANALTKLHLHAIRLAPMLLKKGVPEFYLGGNPFECDCTMGWLRHRSTDVISTGVQQQHHHHHQPPTHHPKIMDYDAIECLVPHKRSQPVRLVSTLSHQDFLCRYETQCPATCHCCEFKTCHCSIKCPDSCTCFHDQSGAINKVNCGKQNALMIPASLPLETSMLYVDGNNFVELKNYGFGILKKLKTLYLNNSNVITLQHNALSGLSGLHKLHLDDNKLTVLYGYEFSQLYNLRELYLQDNLLTYIDNVTFSALVNLQVLRLDGNRIAHLTTWQMQSSHLKNMKSLMLGDNSWSCGCEFLQEFVAFIYMSDVIVRDSDNLHCIDAEVKRRIDANFTDVLCTAAKFDSNLNNIVTLPDGIPHGYVPLIGFGLTIIFVLAILVAIFTIKEQMCCVNYKAGTGTDKAGNIKILYDSLVLSAGDDVDYVAHTIVSELRHSKPSLRFGIQHKNVSTSNIMYCAQRSKKIIIYLSNSFLQTEWKRPEVRSTIANSWIPGKIIIIQTPNVIFATNTDRELMNNIGRGVVLLKTWEIDFALKLAYSIDTHPSHYVEQGHYSEKIWKSTNSQVVHPYTYAVDYMGGGGGDVKTDSYYSTATAESVFSNSPSMQMKVFVGPAQCASSSPPPPLVTLTNVNHVYAGIDSDYGSVTNEDSIISVHRPTTAVQPKVEDSMNITLTENGSSCNSSENNLIHNNRPIDGFLV